jgi:choline-sulfatase
VTAPNIVLVMSDQHRADVLGCAGDGAVQSPHIDSLAARGVRFTRTSCQGPLCMPARASFLTERYVRDHGVFTNWTAVDEGSPTYLHALRAAGYHTAMLGKAHLYRDDLDGVAHVDELAPHLHALGFDEVQESGDKFFGMPNRYSDHLAGEGLLDVYRAHIRDRSYQGEKETGRNATKRVPMWDSTPIPLPLASYIDAWHGELAARWVEAYDRDKPFFLFVGFPGPHDPWDAPAEAVARYAGTDVPMPPSTARPDVDAAGSYGRLLRGFLHLSDTGTMTDDAIRGMRRAYHAAVTVIDDGVGRVVAALRARGMLDGTWVIYTSDHGEMGGDHGLMSKCVFYRQAVNVPLVVAPPTACAPRSVDDLVEHVDLAATVRAIAGAPGLPGSEGRPLLGYLDGGVGDRREVTVSENWGFALFETPRFKLVVDEDTLTPCQLFDVAADPTEDHNRAADPECAAVVEGLMEQYVRPFFATPPVRTVASPFSG